MKLDIYAGEPYHRPYRIVMAVLILIVNFCTMVPYVAPAVFMGQIMESFQVDLSLASLSMTIQLGATGICMFIGSFILDKLGLQKSLILSVWSMALGNVLACIAPNITVFLVARFIAGFGQGLYTVSMNPILTTWFEGKELTFMLTGGGIFSSIALAISYSINLPLCNMLGNWQAVFGVYAGFITVIAILWTLFGKSSPEGIAAEKATKQIERGEKQQSSLLRAAKEVEYWKLMVYASIMMVANTAIATFLPTYLTTERGMDMSIATTISSLNSLFGIAGSLLGGILCAQLWRRKPTLVVAIAIYIAVGFGITVFESSAIIIVLALASGALYFVPLTTQGTVLIEAKQPVDPTILGGASCIVSGIGQLLCVFVSFIFSAIATATSMTMAYRIFFAACLLGLIAAVLLKETGRKTK